MRKQNSLPFENKHFKTIDYLLILLLCQIGWISILLGIPRLEFIVLLLIFYISFRRNKKVYFDNKILLLFIIYGSIALVQGFTWGFSILSLTTSFLLVFITPYYLFKAYNIDFFIILEKVIRILTIIALIIWVAHQFIPDAKAIIISIITTLNKYNKTDVSRSMIFYTYWEALDQNFRLSRNAGFSNEPAAFSVMIILALLINYIKKIQLFNKRNIIYFLGLLSSFSTTGYISLAVLGLLLLKQKKGRIIGILSFPLFIYTALYAYKNLEFMNSKVEQQLNTQTSANLNDPTSGRLLGARKSLYVLSNHPIFGRGLLSVTKPDDPRDPESAGYGWLNEVSRYGIIFGTLFMFYFLKGLYKFIKIGGYGLYEFLVCSLSFMILISAQTVISSAPFMIFFFLGIYDIPERKAIEKGSITSNIARIS
jgi:hypothetical protein